MCETRRRSHRPNLHPPLWITGCYFKAAGRGAALAASTQWIPRILAPSLYGIGHVGLQGLWLTVHGRTGGIQ